MQYLPDLWSVATNFSNTNFVFNLTNLLRFIFLYFICNLQKCVHTQFLLVLTIVKLWCAKVTHIIYHEVFIYVIWVYNIYNDIGTMDLNILHLLIKINFCLDTQNQWNRNWLCSNTYEHNSECIIFLNNSRQLNFNN